MRETPHLDAVQRRQARERALSLAYEADIHDQTVDEVADRYPAPPDDFALELARGTESRRVDADELLARHAHNWSVARMPAIDRAILRIAIYELFERPEVSKAVILNEAVELAKRFSSDEAPAFINGVLAACATEVRRDRPAPA